MFVSFFLRTNKNNNKRVSSDTLCITVVFFSTSLQNASNMHRYIVVLPVPYMLLHFISRVLGRVEFVPVDLTWRFHVRCVMENVVDVQMKLLESFGMLLNSSFT